jgi:hypothetical protein
VEAGLAIRALAPHAATLEDLFFRLTEDAPEPEREPEPEPEPEPAAETEAGQ